MISVDVTSHMYFGFLVGLQLASKGLVGELLLAPLVEQRVLRDRLRQMLR